MRFCDRDFSRASSFSSLASSASRSIKERSTTTARSTRTSHRRASLAGLENLWEACLGEGRSVAGGLRALREFVRVSQTACGRFLNRYLSSPDCCPRRQGTKEKERGRQPAMWPSPCPFDLAELESSRPTSSRVARGRRAFGAWEQFSSLCQSTRESVLQLQS